MTNTTKTQLVPSISYSQHDIIRWIIRLHLDGTPIHCDPTYGKGNFYKPKDIEEPKFASDANPLALAELAQKNHREIYLFEADNLPIADESIRSLMFDPPFLQTTGKGSIIKDRFGSYSTMKSLWEFYAKALWEFCRVLEPKGTLIVKCQNTVMSGKQWWSVNYIKNLASEFGLGLVDEFVLLAKHRMPQHNLKRQRHARKYHSYFLVFRKGNARASIFLPRELR